ncbi:MULTISPECIES: SBBP repeat-containing protein [Oceanotoga]|uniref:Beta-propeller repeat-containing protein n=1 Tax=Oceanotoga teriensis TaxID=515440 RepID=A0AA45HJT0_9BACT|nr:MULTISPECIES: SBBP repeat-containing protein [Oceanotoga]MDN5342116.1 hypothetical protein [Oceanotoga sp.]MDO7975414.1 SBBP repeat-containing protein [Oceanotoga teriensis]PWJ96298.1 beta-propeller repeat-containing protein [Oceanotoga teriensis]
MKPRILVIMVLLVGLLSFAAPNLDWGRVYPMEGEQEIFYVNAVEDGAYLFGVSDPNGYNEDGLVIKLNSKGEILSKELVGGSNNDWLLWGFEDFDGNPVAVGSTRSYSTDYDIFLAKLGENGFKKNIKNFGIEKGTAMVELNDSYILLGYGTDPKTLNMKGKLIKVSKDSLDVVWTKWLPIGQAGSDIKPLSMELTTDGNLIIAGTIVDFFEGRTKFMMTKVTLTGEELWTNVFTGRDYARGFEVKEVKDGYVAVGYDGSWKDGWSDFYLVKFSKDGKMLWESGYGDIKSDHGYSVKEGPNNNLYVAGYTTPEGKNDKDIILLEFNSDGYIESTKIIGGDGDDVAYSLDIDEKGNIYVAGYSTSKDFGSDDKDIIVFKYTIK